MDAKERYFWDLTGHLVVPQVLSPGEIAEANEAIDYYTREILKIQDSDNLPGRPDVRATTVVRTSNKQQASLFPGNAFAVFRSLQRKCSSIPSTGIAQIQIHHTRRPQILQK